MKIIEDWRSVDFKKIVELYDSVGWSAYTESPKLLEEAFKNSTYVLIAIDGDMIIGLSRSISDNVSIHYLQDILVSPKYQKKGVGRKLLLKALEYFDKVRTHMILTDDEEKQLKFYESLGYKNTKELKKFHSIPLLKCKALSLTN